MARRRFRRDPVPAGDLVGRWRRRGGAGGGSGMAALRAQWATAAGPAVAQHAIPLRRSRAGIVTIGCADAGWAQELADSRQRLLDRLRMAGAGDVVDLRFAVSDRAPAGPPPPPSAPAPPRPGPAEMARATTAAATVADERLRDLVRRAAAASLARRNPD